MPPFCRQNLVFLGCDMTAHFKTLILTKLHDQVLQVTLNRPEVRNAINLAMMQDLLYFWQEFVTQQKDLRCIVLTGSGDKAFCAGADLKARHGISVDEWRSQHAVLQQAMLAMHDCSVPIIAAVNGAAFGGGLELALAADFAYAADTALFSQAEVKLGLMPGALGTQNLPRACGVRRAKELTFTGDTFSATEAYEWGMINKICLPSALIQTVLAVAVRIAENASFAVKQAKKSLNASQGLDIKSGYSFEVEAYNLLLPTADREEGINAFVEKRKPRF